MGLPEVQARVFQPERREGAAAVQEAEGARGVEGPVRAAGDTAVASGERAHHDLVTRRLDRAGGFAGVAVAQL